MKIFSIIQIASFIKEHWKAIVIAFLCVTFFIMMFPMAITTIFLPSSSPEQVDEYKMVAEDSGLDWSELVVYDTVRYNNDFSKAVPYQTPFEFLRVTLREYHYESYEVYNSKTDKWVTKYRWVLKKRMTGDDYSSISSILRYLDYNVSRRNMKLKSVISFFEDIDGEEFDDIKYETDVTLLTLDDLVVSMDEDHRIWAYELSSSLHFYYGGVSPDEDYYLPPGMVAFTFPSPKARIVTSHFGWRVHPVYHTKKFHSGVDLWGENCYGTPVVAAADGEVLQINKNSNIDAGWFIRIRHKINGDEWQTSYCHLSEIHVKPGDKVKKGETIGAIGNTGVSTGPHLHFTLKYKGGLVNPLPYINN